MPRGARAREVMRAARDYKRGACAREYAAQRGALRGARVRAVYACVRVCSRARVIMSVMSFAYFMLHLSP